MNANYNNVVDEDPLDRLQREDVSSDSETDMDTSHPGPSSAVAERERTREG